VAQYAVDITIHDVPAAVDRPPTAHVRVRLPARGAALACRRYRGAWTAPA
jgi:hypothetical protein